MEFNKKSLAVAFSLLLSCLALGQNNVGTLVTDPIRPFSVNSTNPSAIANEIKGGPFSSSNLVGLSNIPAPRLELGALGYAADTELYYRLTATNPATWSSINGANITNISLSGVVGALGYDTNGNVIYDGTNALNFTNVNISLTRGGGSNDLSLQVGTNFTGFYVSSSSSATWAFVFNASISMALTTNANQFWKPLSFINTTNAAITRTNLELGWAALTNTSASGFGSALYGSNTNPVLVNTNGEVVSPTNFWQVAPIVTRFVEFDPPTNASTNIVAARNLHIHSLAISRTGVTSTIALPTNNSFNGDIALVVHQGPTSSVTAIRQAGSVTNLITLNQPEQAVEFVYYNNVWQFNHNLSYVEPIFFSGTNAATNAAASRTNLGLGWLALTNPQSSLYSGTATKLLGYVPEINPSSSNLTGYNVLAYTNTNSLVIPANILIGEDLAGGPRNTRNVELNGTLTIKTPFSSPTTIYANNAITATDDSSYTNVLVSFISNSVGFSNVTASGTLTATSTVTAKTNLVVEGFVNFTTNHTNSNPATNNQIQKFLQIRIGTNAFFLPLYQ